jgi:hypothetical protein
MELLTYGVPLWVVLAYLAFSAAVQALPRPSEASAGWYVWLYSFAHILATNVAHAMDPRKKTQPAPSEKRDAAAE